MRLDELKELIPDANGAETFEELFPVVIATFNQSNKLIADRGQEVSRITSDLGAERTSHQTASSDSAAQIAELTEALEQEKEGRLADVSRLEASVENLRSVARESEESRVALDAAMKKEREQFATKRAELQSSLTNQNTLLSDIKRRSELPDGSVTGVSAGGARGYIGLGAEHRLSEGTVFLVGSRDANKAKAEVVVLRVDRKISEVEIRKISDPVGNPAGYLQAWEGR